MAKATSIVREKAAQMVAGEKLTYREIARRCDVSERTLNNWTKKPRFAARVEAIRQETIQRFTRRGLCRKEYRVQELTKQYETLEQIKEERRADTRFAAIPDWNSGLRTITQFTLIQGSNQQSQGEVNGTGQQSAAQANGHAHDAPGAISSDGAAQVDPIHTEISFLNETGKKVIVRSVLDLGILSQQREILADIAAETGERTKTMSLTIKKPSEMTDEEIEQMLARLNQMLPPEPTQPGAAHTETGETIH